jgi:hypothetical protein
LSFLLSLSGCQCIARRKKFFPRRRRVFVKLYTLGIQLFAIKLLLVRRFERVLLEEAPLGRQCLACLAQLLLRHRLVIVKPSLVRI